MKIYTKTGDDGTTGLFNGQRTAKDSLRVETYGTVDELNSTIGLVRSAGVPSELSDVFKKLSDLLFNLGSDLATPLEPPAKWEVPRITEEQVRWLEELMDTYDAALPKLRGFILPGGSVAASHMHHARTVCRRAERLMVSLAREEKLNPHSAIFMNRLSDFLFMAARYANMLQGFPESEWEKE